MYNTARREMAQKIISAFKNNGYPFGGYVRDLIAQKDFNDLDIFFPVTGDYEYVSDFSAIRKLKALGFLVIDKPGKKIYNDDLGCKLLKRTIDVIDDISGEIIKVDMVRTDHTYHTVADHPFSAIDADVNSLWFNKKTGKVDIAPTMVKYCTIDDVIKNIMNSTFSIPPGSSVRSDRLEKLFLNGYRHVSQSKMAEDQPKEVKMESRGFNQFKSDMEKAAYRSVSTQMTNSVKCGILTAMKNHGADDGAISYITEMLETDVGTAGISALLGNGLPYAPMIGTDPRIVRLSEEFRVAGYSKGMDLIFGILMQYIMPGIMQALQSLPAVEKVSELSANDSAELDTLLKAKMRVAAQVHGSIPDLAAEQEALAEETSLPKRARA